MHGGAKRLASEEKEICMAWSWRGNRNRSAEDQQGYKCIGIYLGL